MTELNCVYLPIPIKITLANSIFEGSETAGEKHRLGVRQVRVQVCLATFSPGTLTKFFAFSKSQISYLYTDKRLQSYLLRGMNSRNIAC